MDTILPRTKKYPHTSAIIRISKNTVSKIIFDSLNIWDTVSIIEKEIYDHIIPILLHHFPGLLNCISIERFSGIPVPIELQKDYLEELSRMKTGRDKKNGIVITLERVDGGNLSDFMKEKTEKDVLSVIFQVLFGISVFSRMLLKHNDLHLDNILISRGSPGIYTYEDKNIEILSQFIPKIIDFGYATSPDYRVTRNLTIDEYLQNSSRYPKNAFSNVPNNISDCYTFLSCLYIQSDNFPLIKTWIKKCINVDYLEKRILRDSYWYILDPSVESGVPIDKALGYLIELIESDTKICKIVDTTGYQLPPQMKIMENLRRKSIPNNISTVSRVSIPYSVYESWNSDCVSIGFDRKTVEKNLRRKYGDTEHGTLACMLLSYPMIHRLSFEFLIQVVDKITFNRTVEIYLNEINEFIYFPYL